MNIIVGLDNAVDWRIVELLGMNYLQMFVYQLYVMPWDQWHTGYEELPNLFRKIIMASPAIEHMTHDLGRINYEVSWLTHLWICALK